ncbi:MAG: NADH-quinone oxidoreductase subunit C, partial [Rhodocyclaceae bacterium]|nr:NADH-quinone oxidoreductase subunit C [Rhodocyclaceae bacterium]
MSLPPDQLQSRVQTALGDAAANVEFACDELTVTVAPARLIEAMTRLRDEAGLRFAQLVDLCGVDWSGYGDGAWDGARYSAVYHLLS